MLASVQLRPTSPSMMAPLVTCPTVGWFCWTLLPDLPRAAKPPMDTGLGYSIDLAIGSAGG
jgi:hypothetical protein